jgi:hypothetical protein
MWSLRRARRRGRFTLRWARGFESGYPLGWRAFRPSPNPFLARKGDKNQRLRGTPPCPRQRGASARPGGGSGVGGLRYPRLDG